MLKEQLPVGIDDMSFYTPRTYLEIEELAIARDIPYAKLNKGLGLQQMAFPDVHEDAATMAAEAIADLMEKNGLRPEDIGRIYMGTESALDNAKPTITYATEMVSQRLGGSFRNCDVVEMTFACIGAVDALQICLDWVGANKERIGIVVASDIAKYEAESTGEYTQGAAAVAMLVKWKPRLLVIPGVFGVAMKSEHDFFKPIREKYTETPVFDGPFSNQCYFDRMSEAMEHFRDQAISKGMISDAGEAVLHDRWARMIFHLPYAYHGKRIFTEQFISELKRAGMWNAFLHSNELEEPSAASGKEWAAFVKSVSKSAGYCQFVKKKIERSQRASSRVGNAYAASVFLALMSTLETDALEDSHLARERIGFVGYGSGSKSKVFEGIVQPGWKEVASRFRVFDTLDDRRPLTYDQYEKLHAKTQERSIAPAEGHFALESIGTSGTTLGARYYGVFRVNGKAEVVRKEKEKMILQGI